MRLAILVVVSSVTASAAMMPKIHAVQTGEKSLQSGQITIALPPGHGFTNAARHLVTLSPDGTRVVYVANNRLYQRAVDGLEAVPLPGVVGTGARNPFYSPDGRWIGFWEDRQLKKISAWGGAPVVLCAAQNPQGVSWTSGDTILYGQGTDGIWRVPAAGGTSDQLVKVDAGQMAQGPQLLPGAHYVLFTLARNDDWDAAQIVVQSLDNGSRRVVIDGATDARYVPTGHVVYASRGTLKVVPFDVATLTATGPPIHLVEDVAQAPTGLAQFATATNGALVYVPKDAVDGGLVRTLVWVDRQGREEPINAPARRYVDPRLSPDGTRVALEIESDIWILDLSDLRLTRLTADPTFELAAIWTPDGRHVIFSSGRSGRSTLDPLNLFRQAANRSGTMERLTDAAAARQVPYAVTPDGSALIFREHSTDPSADPGDIMLMSMDGRRESKPLVQTKFREMNAELSPDGRWLAYQSNESGRDQIYVRPFPHVSAGKWQVSSSGGMRPLWARNSRELFYESSRALMRVEATIGSTFESGTPSKLFDGPYFYSLIERMYDVSPDGRRFLMINESRPSNQPAPTPRLIVVRTFAALHRRVPPK
jgi:eukaryotic-like serine/threonine-protein kinase